MERSLTEYNKMKANIPFDPADNELIKIRAGMREKEMEYNQTTRYEMVRRTEILLSSLNQCGEDVVILPNVHFDYGCNVSIGAHTFINVNCTFIDVASIKIGEHVLIGPNVTICTATHPILAEERMPRIDGQGNACMLEYSHPVVIEDHVWIGAGTILNPGIRIGSGAVIGSGSVVTKDIPPNVVAAGVPCRVLREITERDGLAVKGY